MSGLQCTLDPDTSDPTDKLTEQAVKFCQQVGSTASTVSEIVGRKDELVYQAIGEGIQRVNRKAAAQPYHIQKWAILERDFSISGGELGRFALVLLSTVPGAVWEGGDHGAWEVPVGVAMAGRGPSSMWEDTAPCVGPSESPVRVQGVCWNLFM